MSLGVKNVCYPDFAIGHKNTISCGGGRAYSAETFKDYDSFKTESEAFGYLPVPATAPLATTRSHY